MNREQIMDGFKMLAASQGFYGRLINAIENVSEEQAENFWAELESHNFNDIVDVVMFLEC